MWAIIGFKERRKLSDVKRYSTPQLTSIKYTKVLFSMSNNIKVLSNDFEFVGEGGIDERKRLSLAKAQGFLKERLGGLGASLEDLHFRVYVNAAGQILLDPAVSVPVREMWLYRNPVALAKVREGLAQAAEGELHDLGSFAKYADDDID
jgi:hypothetical protein